MPCAGHHHANLGGTERSPWANRSSVPAWRRAREHPRSEASLRLRAASLPTGTPGKTKFLFWGVVGMLLLHITQRRALPCAQAPGSERAPPHQGTAPGSALTRTKEAKQRAQCGNFGRRPCLGRGTPTRTGPCSCLAVLAAAWAGARGKCKRPWPGLSGAQLGALEACTLLYCHTRLVISVIGGVIHCKKWGNRVIGEKERNDSSYPFSSLQITRSRAETLFFTTDHETDHADHEFQARGGGGGG